MKLEEYKFDHFKNIDEVMYYFNYWYKEEDVYSINRYLSLKDFNYISNKYQELQQENKQLQKDIKNIIKILEKNCDELEATEEEFDSLDRWQGLQTVELEQVMLSYRGLISQQKEFINYLEDKEVSE